MHCLQIIPLDATGAAGAYSNWVSLGLRASVRFLGSARGVTRPRQTWWVVIDWLLFARDLGLGNVRTSRSKDGHAPFIGTRG